MSEPVAPLVASGAASQPVSGGAMLRAAREAQGLHIAALAVSLKVSVKKLEALESDAFDQLPSAVFIRALTSSVCRTLKIDPAPVLQKMPQTSAPLLKTSDGGINIPFRANGAGALRWPLELLLRPYVWVIVGLLVGAAALVIFPLPLRTEGPTTLKTESVLAPASAVAPVAVDAAAADQTAVPGSGATAGAVVFKAHGPSWIEVVDANRVVQVRKNMGDGEVVGVSGAMPLSVVVGRADHTEVVVGGQTFDLTPVTKNNVARFEVR